MKLKPIAQQTLVITGATSGIGLATARAASAAGARVVVAARNERALKDLVMELATLGGAAAYAVADVSREDEVRKIAEVAVDRFGGFDTWFNNAGVAIFGKTEEVSLEDHRRLFDVNYWGVVHGSLVALERLRVHGGALINMGSILSDIVLPLQGPYSASKHAIKGFTDSLRLELMHDRAPVSVTLVKPASVNTPLPEHGRNYLPVKPVLPPPAYDPDVVARAVLQAAQQPMRDVLIGEAGPFLAFGNSLMPEMADRLTEATLFRLQRTDEPADAQPSNLHQPTAGGSVRGNHPLVLQNSPCTQVATNPTVNSATRLFNRIASVPLTVGGRVVSSALGAFIRRPGKQGDAPVAQPAKDT